jgi:hypothetical protein
VVARLGGYLLGFWFRPQRGPDLSPMLALATECFARAPADLPPGSRLYPEQVQAALGLTYGALVEMDTGEGKTYAILPAAFALACTYFRVYILCATSYLAWRDASRTRPYWEFMGVQPGFCDEEAAPIEWSRRVVYTTLRALVFKSLRDDVQASTPEHPLTFGGLILDEADAILLDQTTEAHSLVTHISSAAFDWGFALEYAGALVEQRDVDVDRLQLRATLTVEGSEGLRSRLVASDPRLSRFLLARYAVELAYVATQIATEGVHYVVADGQVHAVDRVMSVPSWQLDAVDRVCQQLLEDRAALSSLARARLEARPDADPSGPGGETREEDLGELVRPLAMLPALHDDGAAGALKAELDALALAGQGRSIDDERPKTSGPAWSRSPGVCRTSAGRRGAPTRCCGANRARSPAGRCSTRGSVSSRRRSASSTADGDRATPSTRPSGSSAITSPANGPSARAICLGCSSSPCSAPLARTSSTTSSVWSITRR